MSTATATREAPGVRIGSVCSGYGGLDMAVQHVAGGTLAWVADPDPGPARILAHHYPDAPNLGDITALDWTDVEPVDVLIGGYPCQPFSTAGKRKGTDDPRHIWPHIARALGALRPRVAFLENVAAHVGLGFGNVLADLAALGWDAEWVCVRASDVGAPHRRNRLFVLAWPAHPGSPGPQGGRAEGAAPDGRVRPGLHTCNTNPARRTLAPVPHGAGPVADPFGVRGCGGWAQRPAGRHEPPLGRLRARHVAVHRPEPHGQAQPRQGGGDPLRGLSPAPDAPGDGRQQGQPPAEGQQRRPDPALSGSPDHPWGPYADAVHRWATITGRHAPRATDTLGRLSPLMVEWMMGLPPGHVTAVPGLSRAAQLKALGNGVVPLQAVIALEHLRDRAAGRGHDPFVAPTPNT